MQAAEWSDAADCDRDRMRHASENPAVEEDSPASDLADVDQLAGVLVFSPTPTEPEATDVTPASTTRVLIGDHHRIRAGMFGQPALGLVVEVDQELHSVNDYCGLRSRACARCAARRNSRTCRSWPST